MDSPLSSQAKTYRLMLSLCHGIGWQRMQRILKHFPDEPSLKNASTKQLQRIGIPETSIPLLLNPNWQVCEKALRWQNHNNHYIVHYDDAQYPELLRHISSPPPVLYVKGQLDLLQSRQIAMVGSRNPSLNGSDIAKRFALDLSRHGFTITSGLALGIDTASHQGALEATGKTIAVLGTGLNQIYPARNRDLAQRILEHGALVSEFPLDTPVNAHNFPRRNRLISGLSQGTLVVEATLKSGSLITTHYAIQQGREVYAIPGSIHNPLAKGCHYLIQNGAKLVQTIDDIVDELPQMNNNWLDCANTQKSIETLDNTYQKLVKCIAYEPTPMDLITHRSELQSGQVASMLLDLEIEGVIAKAPGGYVRKL